MLVDFRQDALDRLPATCTSIDALAQSAVTASPTSQLTNSVALGVSPAASKVSVLSLQALLQALQLLLRAAHP